MEKWTIIDKNKLDKINYFELTKNYKIQKEIKIYIAKILYNGNLQNARKIVRQKMTNLQYSFELLLNYWNFSNLVVLLFKRFIKEEKVYEIRRQI